jgi:hypothetical protein
VKDAWENAKKCDDVWHAVQQKTRGDVAHVVAVNLIKLVCNLRQLFNSMCRVIFLNNFMVL